MHSERPYLHFRYVQFGCTHMLGNCTSRCDYQFKRAYAQNRAFNIQGLWGSLAHSLEKLSAASSNASVLKHQSKFQILKEVGHDPTEARVKKHFSSRVMQQDKIKLAGSLILRAALLLRHLCMWVLCAQWITVLNSTGVHVLPKLSVCLCIHLPACLMGMKNSGEGWDTKEAHSLVISASYVNSSLLSCLEVDVCEYLHMGSRAN